MEFHPLANLFPMMTALESDALAADIAANGLRHPITRYEGKILDGRNRFAACKKADVKPEFVDYEGDDPLGMVISLNIQRRDMTAAQRAIVGARALPLFAEAAKKRMAEGGKNKGKGSLPLPSRQSRDDASAIFKVSDKSVQQAKALIEDDPDLAAQVEACTMSLAAAYAQHQEREKTAKQAAKADAQRVKDAEKVVEYREAVSNGEMSLDAALQAIRDEERKEKEKAEHDAQARQLWFRPLTEFVRWVEQSIATRTDEHLAWYTEPDAPGSDQHELSAEQLAAVIGQLERVRDITFAPKEQPCPDRKR